MKFRGILLAAAILFFAGSFHAYAQEEGVYELPAWLVLEYGKKAFQERELGIALRYAREALEKKAGFYPEAEILIGDVFAAEGNLQLAVSQYTKALEDSRQLYILQEKYHILYRLADIYHDLDEDVLHRQVLVTIVDDDEYYTATLQSSRRNTMINTVTREGIDKLVELFRLRSDYSLTAHSRLGALELEAGNGEEAVLHLLFSVLTILTRAIEEHEFHDPTYRYTTADDFFARVEGDRLIQDYFQETRLFENLFLMGKSIETAGGSLQAVRGLWNSVLQFSGNRRLNAVIREELVNLSPTP